MSERPEDVISEALDTDEAMFGMRHPAALAALEKLVAERDDARALRDDAVEKLLAVTALLSPPNEGSEG